jgi:tetratricopeptide (TPR) repeat protein
MLWYAEVLLANQDFQTALDYYQACCRLVPGDIEARLAMVECHFSLGQMEAASNVENLLAQNPNQLRGLLLSAKINMAKGAWDNALVRLRQAQAIAPHLPEMLQALIVVLRQLHRSHEADQLEKKYRHFLEKGQQLAELGEKIQAEPGDASLRYQAGKLCLELGLEKAATDWFQSVFWIDPNHRPTHSALAEYWATLGQPQRAAYHRRRAEGKPR